MDKIELSFIIVNWNTRELAEQCISSILQSGFKGEFEIILIDNGSSDGSADYLKSKFNNLVLIKNQENLGFAKANNQGLICARGKFAVLVNSDIVANRAAIEVPLDFLVQHKDVAIIGCNLIDGFTHRIQKFSFGYKPNLLRVFNQFLGLFNFSKIVPFFRGINSVSIKVGPPVLIDWVTGAYLFVRMDAYRQLGGLNEDYFFYVEDMEWCVRLRKNNWKVYFLPNISVIHFLGSSQKTVEQRIKMSCNWYKNLRGFFSENHSKLSIFFFDLFGVIGFGSRYIVTKIKSLIRGKDIRFTASSNLAIVKTAAMCLLNINCK